MIELAYRVEAAAWRTDIPDLEKIAESAVSAIASLVKLDQGEISLYLADNPQIQDLNRAWRGKDRPTDVLSFPADPMDHPFLGDIALSFGILSSDAQSQNKTLEQHLSHLLIHGVLHLLGHDHMNATEAEEMEALERSALASLGWPDPYI